WRRDGLARFADRCRPAYLVAVPVAALLCVFVDLNVTLQAHVIAGLGFIVEQVGGEFPGRRHELQFAAVGHVAGEASHLGLRIQRIGMSGDGMPEIWMSENVVLVE